MRDFLRTRLPLLANLVLVLAAICLTGCLTGCVGGGSADPYSKRYTASDINPAPGILDGTIVRGTDLTGLVLENVRVKDATFLDTTAKNARFTNVVFDNCRFINAKFSNTVMENVTFKGGILTGGEDAATAAQRTEFANARFKNLVLDGTYLENAAFNGSNGSITFRNVQNVIASAPVITGKNVRITLQDCYFNQSVIAEVTGASTLTAVNCTFYHATFGNSSFKTVAFSKNVTYGGPLLKGRTSFRKIAPTHKF